MLGYRDSTSASICFLPGMYSISRLYYSSISLHRNTRSVLKFLRVIFLGSLNIFNCWTNRIVRNSFSFLTIQINSFYVNLYRVCGPVSLQLHKSIGLPSWIITDPSWSSMASICISKHLLKSGYSNKVSWVTELLISSNAFFYTSFHLNFILFDVSSVKGYSKCDRLAHISLL